MVGWLQNSLIEHNQKKNTELMDCLISCKLFTQIVILRLVSNLAY